jgi:hypothetical protein
MTEPIVVEQGIPIPPRHKYSLGWLSVMRKMHVGESFLCATNKDVDTVRGLFWKLKKEGLRFQSRKTDEGVRVWRVLL